MVQSGGSDQLLCADLNSEAPFPEFDYFLTHKLKAARCTLKKKKNEICSEAYVNVQSSSQRRL